MKQLRQLALPLAFLMCVTVQAEEKKETGKASLVGTWEAVKGSETLPLGSTLEFTKEGKLKITIKQGDKNMVIEGTYKLDGTALKATLKDGDKEHTETLKIKLAAKELVTIDEKGKKDVLKKK